MNTIQDLNTEYSKNDKSSRTLNNEINYTETIDQGVEQSMNIKKNKKYKVFLMRFAPSMSYILG